MGLTCNSPDTGAGCRLVNQWLQPTHTCDLLHLYMKAQHMAHLISHGVEPDISGCRLMCIPPNLCYKPRRNPQLKCLVSSCSGLCQTHWSQVSCRQWTCSWSSTNRQCSNYIWDIWVIYNSVAYWGAAYITGFMVAHVDHGLPLTNMDFKWQHG